MWESFYPKIRIHYLVSIILFLAAISTVGRTQKSLNACEVHFILSLPFIHPPTQHILMCVPGGF